MTRAGALTLSAICWAFTSVNGAPATSRRDAAFYVGSHGWHTSIVLPRTAISPATWPKGVADRTFAKFTYLEIGWGDRKFYTAPKPNAAMALDAVLLPGPSVLHVVGLNPPLRDALPWSALVRVECTRAELAQLSRALGESFEQDCTAIGPGLYGLTSRFYPARGRYSLFNTCDTWTARMLRAGGLSVRTDVAGTYSAGAVLGQARRAVAQRTRR